MEQPLNCGRLRHEAAAARARRLGPSLARWPIPSLGRDSGGATRARPYDGPPVIDSAGSRLVWRPTRQLVAFRGRGSIDWLCRRRQKELLANARLLGQPSLPTVTSYVGQRTRKTLEHYGQLVIQRPTERVGRTEDMPR